MPLVTKDSYCYLYVYVTPIFSTEADQHDVSERAPHDAGAEGPRQGAAQVVRGRHRSYQTRGASHRSLNMQLPLSK